MQKQAKVYYLKTIQLWTTLYFILNLERSSQLTNPYNLCIQRRRWNTTMDTAKRAVSSRERMK